MKDKSSGVNSNEIWRLSPGCSRTFANRLSRFKGGRHAREVFVQVQLNDFLAGAGAAVLHRYIHAYGLAPQSRGRSNAQIGGRRNSCSSTPIQIRIARVQHFPFCRIFPFEYFVVVSEETIRPAGDT